MFIRNCKIMKNVTETVSVFFFKLMKRRVSFKENPSSEKYQLIDIFVAKCGMLSQALSSKVRDEIAHLKMTRERIRDIRESNSTSLAYRRVPAVCIGHLMRSVRSLTAGQCPLVGSACCERTNDRTIDRLIVPWTRRTDWFRFNQRYKHLVNTTFTRHYVNYDRFVVPPIESSTGYKPYFAREVWQSGFARGGTKKKIKIVPM